MTSLAKVVASVARVALQNPNVNLVQDLERDSQTLDRIRDSFSRILDKQTWTVWSFVEELATAGMGKVYIHPHMQTYLDYRTGGAGRFGYNWRCP